MTVNELQALQDKHLAIWKERDAATREQLMTEIYSANIRMYDKDFTLTGYQEISGFITKLHTADTHFDFAAAKPIDATQHSARLFWTIQTRETGAPLTGMDFFILKDGKVSELFVFIDAPVASGQ